MGEPRMPYRVRPAQVLQGVGAVLVVTAAVAVAGSYGGVGARLPLMLLAAVAAVFSVRAQRRELRGAEETLAACAGGLAVVAGAWAGTLRVGSAIPLAAVAACCLVLHRVAPTTAVWPLASWVTLQLAVLRAVDAVPAALHAWLFVVVALVGLAVALRGRRLVARVALVTTVPWWVLGVAATTARAWTGSGAERLFSAVLVVAAAGGLLVTRFRPDLHRLLSSQPAVPVLAGAPAGLAVSGAAAVLGTPGITVAGYAGLLTATVLPENLRDRPRELFGPVAVAAGSVMALAALVHLSAGMHWTALTVLLLLTAAPAVVIAWRRPEERQSAVPTALGCLTAAAVLAIPAGLLRPVPAAVVLTALYGAGLFTAAALPHSARRPPVIASGAAAVAALVLTAVAGDRGTLALVVAAQGVLTTGWGWWTTRSSDRPPSPAWRIGAAELTVAAWIAVARADLHVLEGYTLPLAAGLLLAAGPRLRRGPSWPAWGPGLLVAAVPSAVAAVVLPGSTRPIVVLATAAIVMVAAGATGLRAPLVIGAATAVGTTLGLALVAELWPVAGALLIGAGLLAVGARREQVPGSFFRYRLAELR